jgi:hypothetical protein
MMRKIPLFGALIFFIAGCGTAKNMQTPLTFRYQNLQPTKTFDATNALIDIKVQPSRLEAVDTSKTSGKTLFDLHGAGQAAVLGSVEKSAEVQKKVLKLLNKQFQAPPGPVDKDLSKQTYTINLSIGAKDFFKNLTTTWSLADRLDWLDLQMNIPDSQQKFVRFRTWDKIATQYASYTVAGISYERDHDLTINPSIPVGAGSFSVGSYEAKNDVTTGDSIRRPIVRMTGTLQAHTLDLEQNGSPEISLFGNTFLTIQFSFPQTEKQDIFFFDGFRDDDGKFQDVTKLSVQSYTVTYPQLLADIPIDLTANYRIRHVNGESARTYEESDDDVTYYAGNYTMNIPAFIKKKDVQPETWSIQSNTLYFGLLDPVSELYYPLAFDSYSAALEFEKWARVMGRRADNVNVVGDYKIVVSSVKNPDRSLSYVFLNKHTDFAGLKIVDSREE